MGISAKSTGVDLAIENTLEVANQLAGRLDKKTFKEIIKARLNNELISHTNYSRAQRRRMMNELKFKGNKL